jgi:predicted transcriptional regulator
MTIIKVPDELAHEIDRLAGAKKRSAFAIDVLWREVRRNRQRETLRASAGSWKNEDHPELARGGAAYVEEIRAERDGRFEDALNRHQR